MVDRRYSRRRGYKMVNHDPSSSFTYSFSLTHALCDVFFRYFTINNSFSFLLERVLNFEVIFKNEVLNCGLFEQQKWTQSINTAYWQKNKNDQRFYAMADRLSLAHSHLRSGTIFSLI